MKTENYKNWTYRREKSNKTEKQISYNLIDAGLLRYVAMGTQFIRDIDTTCYSFKSRGAHTTEVKSTNKQMVRLPLHMAHLLKLA